MEISETRKRPWHTRYYINFMRFMRDVNDLIKGIVAYITPNVFPLAPVLILTFTLAHSLSDSMGFNASIFVAGAAAFSLHGAGIQLCNVFSSAFVKAYIEKEKEYKTVLLPAILMICWMVAEILAMLVLETDLGVRIIGTSIVSLSPIVYIGQFLYLSHLQDKRQEVTTEKVKHEQIAHNRQMEIDQANHERQMEIDRANHERQMQLMVLQTGVATNAGITVHTSQSAIESPKDWRVAKRVLSIDEKKTIAMSALDEVKSKYGLSSKTARRWIDNCQKEVSQLNGHLS